MKRMVKLLLAVLVMGGTFTFVPALSGTAQATVPSTVASQLTTQYGLDATQSACLVTDLKQLHTQYVNDPNIVADLKAAPLPPGATAPADYSQTTVLTMLGNALIKGSGVNNICTGPVPAMASTDPNTPLNPLDFTPTGAGTGFQVNCIDSVAAGQVWPCYVPPDAYTEIFGISYAWWFPYGWLQTPPLCETSASLPFWSVSHQACDSYNNPTNSMYPGVVRDIYSVNLGYGILNITWYKWYWYDFWGNGGTLFGCRQC